MSNYESITTRKNQHLELKELTKRYPNITFNDVINAYPNKNIVLAITGLEKELPVLQELISKKEFSTYLKSLKDDSFVLIDVKNERILMNNLEQSYFKKDIKEVLDKFSNYGGYLNEFGEHVYDLKSSFIGPHYAVNLLLGDRSKLSEPLLTTPKGVVDMYGGGSFRGPASQQVLATRWDMDPSENGNPFNRQFYLLENNKQIFYSHNVHENVRKAICTHKVNRTEIEYETLDNLKIKRTIYLKRQHKEEEPIALERQVVEITNESTADRDLDIVFTGMFGSANPGCQMVDVIYQSVINETNIITE